MLGCGAVWLCVSQGKEVLLCRDNTALNGEAETQGGWRVEAGDRRQALPHNHTLVWVWGALWSPKLDQSPWVGLTATHPIRQTSRLGSLWCGGAPSPATVRMFYNRTGPKGSTAQDVNSYCLTENSITTHSAILWSCRIEQWLWSDALVAFSSWTKKASGKISSPHLFILSGTYTTSLCWSISAFISDSELSHKHRTTEKPQPFKITEIVAWCGNGWSLFDSCSYSVLCFIIMTQAGGDLLQQQAWE